MAHAALTRDVHQAFSDTFSSAPASTSAYAAEMLLELLGSPEEMAEAAEQAQHDIRAARTRTGDAAEEEEGSGAALAQLQQLVNLAMPQAQPEEAEAAALRLLARNVLQRAEEAAEARQRAQQQQRRLAAATTPGTDVLALLPQDGEYHPATVVGRASDAGGQGDDGAAAPSSRGLTAGKRRGRRKAGPSASGAADSTAAASPHAAAVVHFFEFGGLELTVRVDDIIPLGEDDEDAGNDGDGDDETAGSGACELCGRDFVRLTRHHLRPRQLHSRLLAQGVSRETLNLTTDLCRSCHSMVHRAESNSDLAAKFNTIEALRAHPALARWAVYAARLRTGTRWDHAVLMSQGRR